MRNDPFGSGGNADCQPEAKPPVDLNTPVTNPLLKAAIAAWQRGPSPETKRGLFEALTSANYLVAIMTDEMKMAPGPVSGHVKISAGSRIKVMCCSNANNEPFLPAFTDWEEIRAWTRENVSTLVMPANQLWSFALGGYAGVVINPAGAALELKAAALMQLKGPQ